MKRIFFYVIYFLFSLAFSNATAFDSKSNLQELKNGAVMFTFDDCDIDGWLKSIDLFKKYNAHATFFFSHKIGSEQIECMKKLKSAGHSLGLHGYHHTNAPEYIAKHGADSYLKRDILPQLVAIKEAGLNIENFAFPNNRYNDIALSLLQKYFKRFRAGCGTSLMTPNDVAYQNAFFAPSLLSKKIVFRGFGVGAYYSTTEKALLDAIEKASRENKVIVLFSHKIYPNARGVNMPLELLEAALKKAKALDMAIIGFDDIK